VRISSIVGGSSSIGPGDEADHAATGGDPVRGVAVQEDAERSRLFAA
jgi:hypothetical protein